MDKSYSFKAFEQRKISDIAGKKITFKRLIVPVGHDASAFRIYCTIKSDSGIDFFKPVIPPPDPYRTNIEEVELDSFIEVSEGHELHLQIQPPEHLLSDDSIITLLNCQIS